LKGIRNFDTTLAYEAMKAAAEYTAFGIPAFNNKVYLETGDEDESVSRSLEYAYDNYCIARIAEWLKKPEEAKLYYRRAQGYKNLFNDSTGMMRPRRNGNWYKPFIPEEVNGHYTEANAWQYSFYVPQDVQGLIALHGGAD